MASGFIKNEISEKCSKLAKSISSSRYVLSGVSPGLVIAFLLIHKDMAFDVISFAFKMVIFFQSVSLVIFHSLDLAFPEFIDDVDSAFEAFGKPFGEEEFLDLLG